MKDVALRAAVSSKTVSNVVRGWPHVSEATRARVESALDDLGYRYNHSPTMLRSGRSGILALAMPWLDSPYFAELTSEIVRRADARGWTVVVDQTDGLRERELKVLEGLRGQPIDGLIYSPYALSVEDLAKHKVSIPMTLLGERVPAGRMDHVAIDNVSAAMDVVTHLIGTGRERVAALGYQAISAGENARQRGRGYELAMRAAGRELSPGLQVQVSVFERAAGAAAMRQLLNLRPRPDAVFCFSDLLALGAMYAIREAGLTVPEDIAVAGFDDIEDGRYSNPPLTTIRPDKNLIAQSALDLVLSRLANEEEEPGPRHISPGYDLLIRASSTTTPPAPPA